MADLVEWNTGVELGWSVEELSYMGYRNPKGRGKGGKGSATINGNRVCYHCGKSGHFARQCWTNSPALKPNGKGGGKAGTKGFGGKTGGGGKGQGGGKNGPKGGCFTCGGAHFQSDCTAGVRAVQYLPNQPPSWGAQAARPTVDWSPPQPSAMTVGGFVRSLTTILPGKGGVDTPLPISGGTGEPFVACLGGAGEPFNQLEASGAPTLETSATQLTSGGAGEPFVSCMGGAGEPLNKLEIKTSQDSEAGVEESAIVKNPKKTNMNWHYAEGRCSNNTVNDEIFKAQCGAPSDMLV